MKEYIHSKVLLFISKLFKQAQVIPQMLHMAEREREREVETHTERDIFILRYFNLRAGPQSSVMICK